MDERLFFPATSRNYKYISKVLSSFLPKTGLILEVASGSGEHAVQFQKQFPDIIWQASDPNPTHRRSINAWIKHENLTKKMPQPLNLDVSNQPWQFPQGTSSAFNGIICINLLHISPWRCTKALLKEAKKHLNENNPIIIYGPFMRNGRHTSKSNELFDRSLKVENPEWGVRDLEGVISLAISCGFTKRFVIEMPANNLTVIFSNN